MNKKQMQVVAELYAENDKLETQNKLLDKKCNELQQENQLLHNKIDKAIDFIDIYTNGINLEAFDCLKLMYKVKDFLKDSDVDE